MKKKITFAIAGCGNRGLEVYALCLERYADRAQIVAVADTRPDRVQAAAERYHIPRDRCFDSAESMLRMPKMADVLIIATPDNVHYQQAMDALSKGYHLLLEKPVARSVKECSDIAELAKQKGLHVLVCHVLRYTVFYQTIKRFIDEGYIGQIMNVEATERVAYWHHAHSYVRGNWHVSAQTTPMIMAKSCHDFDIILWLTGKRCEAVSSFGHLSHFTTANKPEGAPERCSDKCPVANDCPYNAETFYLSCYRDGGDCWPANVVVPEPAEEKIRQALAENNYGRCVYQMDNDVVDHQVVSLQLEDQVTAAFTMTAFTAEQGRWIRICGTKGELSADMEKNLISVRSFGADEIVIDVRALTDDFSGHGGGDVRMVEDMLDLMDGKDTPKALTTIDRSVESHYIALAAEESRVHGGRVIALSDFVQRHM